MTPSTRKEIYLNKIATGEGTIPTPATREEMYLAKIAGEEVEVPTPATRVEVYLYKIAGGSIIIPTPATRLEMFLAAASGMPVSIPVPATREEILWDYIINGINPQMITGVPPINFTANGKPLISWSMLGNGQQTGTPSPDNIIIPDFCGERTRNLAYGRIESVNVGTDGRIVQTDVYDLAIARVENGVVYTANSFVLAFYIDEPVIGSVSYNQSRIVATQGIPTTFVAPITGYVVFRIAPSEPAMLNLGSTTLPYEPYGIKIPISSAGQTTPVYLGEVETTRKIKKYVFTGQEAWSLDVATGVLYTFVISDFLATNGITCMCSHYSAQNNASGVAEVQNKRVCFRTSKYNQFYLKDTDFNSIDALKSYLAAQYSAGTPVTVWYVLAEPETAIVNEPLCKIGDYADELHSTDVGVSIPTVKGSNTLTVETDLQPSSMTITGYIAESQTMTAAKIMARASGMDVNDKELESLSKKELNSILKGAVKSGG